MKIRFSKHSLERLSKRGINKKEVIEALLKGQSRAYQQHGTIKCVYKKSNRNLVIIYYQNKEQFKIVTAYYED